LNKYLSSWSELRPSLKLWLRETPKALLMSKYTRQENSSFTLSKTFYRNVSLFQTLSTVIVTRNVSVKPLSHLCLVQISLRPIMRCFLLRAPAGLISRLSKTLCWWNSYRNWKIIMRRQN